MPFYAPNRGKTIFEFYDVTQSNNLSLIKHLDLIAASTGVVFDWSASDYKSYRAPAILQANHVALSTFDSYSLSLYANGLIEQTNSYWGGSPDLALIQGTPYSGYDDGAVIYDKFSVGVPYTIVPINATHGLDTPSLLTVDRLFGSPYANETGLGSTEQAWLSYDVTSGVNTKKVFAYSVTLLNDLSGIGDTNVGSDATLPTLLVGYAPQSLTGFCTAVELLLGQSGFCQSPDPQEEPTQQCLSGDPPSQAVLQAAISGAIVAALTKQRGQQINPTNSDLANVSVASDFNLYTGAIQFNTPAYGDIVHISSYNYPQGASGYMLAYSGIYGHLPPYPQYDFYLYYGSNYTDVNTLALAINNVVGNNTDFQLWADLPCTHKDGEGYFEGGPMLKATVTDSNTVFLESDRIGSQGNYLVEVITGARPFIAQPVNILKYLLPTTIRLQGANTYGVWTDLDVQSGVDWLSVTPTQVFREVPVPIESGNQPPPPTQAPVGVSGSGEKKLIYTLNVTGLDRCGQEFSDVTEFFSADPLNGCSDPTEDDKEDPLQKILGDIGGGTTKVVAASYLKTGWKFNNPNDYNFYRLYFQDFASTARGLQANLSNEFSIANINFYGTLSGYQPYSGDMCVIGSNYQVHIEGLTSGIITGTASGYADDASKGIYCFDGQLVQGMPNADSAFASGAFYLFGRPSDAQVLHVPIYGQYVDIEADVNLSTTSSHIVTISGIDLAAASGEIVVAGIPNDGDVIHFTSVFGVPYVLEFDSDGIWSGDFPIAIDSNPTVIANTLWQFFYYNLSMTNSSQSGVNLSIVQNLPISTGLLGNYPLTTTSSGIVTDGLTGGHYLYTQIPISGIASGFYQEFENLGLSPVWHDLGGQSSYRIDLTQPYGGLSGSYPMINEMSGVSVSGFSGGFGAFTTIPDRKVRFQTSLGVPTTPFTGVLFGCETGADYYIEPVGGYFYDVDQQAIYFSELVSGEITGQGYLYGGPYNIVESGYLQSGIKDTQYVVTNGDFNYSGFIPNFDFPFTNRLGFSYLSGSVTQVILSGGCVLVQATITGNVEDAWQFGPTGYNNATGLLRYNTPELFDSIAINGVPIAYGTGDLFGPSSYYDSIDTLVNIINSGEDVFMAHATKLSSSLVRLDSLLSGTSGNQILLGADGSDTRPKFDAGNLFGGLDYFAPMNPTSAFTGQLSMNLCATAYFSSSASGQITGDIANISYYRTFTGVWNLVTGSENFLNNGWNDSDSYFASATTFANTPTFFTIGVNYSNDPVEESPDYAVLTISGINFPTGIQLILSGQY